MRIKAKRIWHKSKNPKDKKIFNRINNQLNRLIKDINNTNFENYLKNFQLVRIQTIRYKKQPDNLRE